MDFSTALGVILVVIMSVVILVSFYHHIRIQTKSQVEIIDPIAPIDPIDPIAPIAPIDSIDQFVQIVKTRLPGEPELKQLPLVCECLDQCFIHRFKSFGGIVVNEHSNNWLKLMKIHPGSKIIHTRLPLVHGNYGNAYCNCCNNTIEYLGWMGQNGRIRGYEYLCKCICISNHFVTSLLLSFNNI